MPLPDLPTLASTPTKPRHRFDRRVYVRHKPVRERVLGTKLYKLFLGKPLSGLVHHDRVAHHLVADELSLDPVSGVWCEHVAFGSCSARCAEQDSAQQPTGSLVAEFIARHEPGEPFIGELMSHGSGR